MIRPVFHILFALLLVLSFPAQTLAKGTVKVGDAIPHDLTIKDSAGKMRSFSDLTGEKGMVLVFVRSAEWCPFCQKQLIELNENLKKFTDEGYNVVSVSYDGPEQLKKFTATNSPKFTMLSDPASEVIKAFGIMNEASAKGTMSYGIAHPGVYIVAKDKKVQATFFKEDYKERPSIDELVGKIKELNAPPEPVMEDVISDPIVPGEDIIETPEKITEPVVIPENMGDPAPVNPTPDPVLTPENMEAPAEETPSTDMPISGQGEQPHTEMHPGLADPGATEPAPAP